MSDPQRMFRFPPAAAPTFPAPTAGAAVRSLDGWLRHIESVHFRSIDLSLDRPRRVLHLLRLPMPPHAIVIAGTNGKGSCVAMLESILTAAGRRVGAYTSPHLVHYNERVRIDGAAAGDEELCEAFEAVETARRGIPLTYFEFGTLAALWLFHRCKVDIAVLEVGMGGRLDAVNLVDADVSLLTSIGLDHEQWLGRGRERIAAEKCGIMRFSRPTVCCDPDPPAAVLREARRRGARLFCLGREFRYRGHGDCWHWSGPFRSAGGGRVDLRGLPLLPSPAPEQWNNAAGVVAAIGLLPAPFRIAARDVISALGRVRLPARLERTVIGDGTELLLDVAHNPDSIRVLARHLRARPPAGRTIAVFAMLGDKDIAGSVAGMADLVDHWKVATLDNERAVDAAVLAGRIAELNPRGTIEAHRDVAAAFEAALDAAGPGDCIVVFGSFYTVGEVIGHMERVAVHGDG